MNTKKLTKQNILIALVLNFSLMAVSYKMGFCLNVAIPCTIVWMGVMGVVYVMNSRAANGRAV